MDSSTDPVRDVLDFPQAGETGRLLRAMDWSGSPLGLPATWPQSLRAAVGLLLSSSAQICLFWGPELVAFYNDAYRPAIGANHPHALGEPARIGWSALWEVLEPLLRDVQQTGLPFERRQHLFRQNRQGFEENTWFDVFYSPVPGDQGTVEGVFCIVADQTRRVLDERRLLCLRALAMQPRIDSALEAARGFVSILTEEEDADVPYALVYLRQRDGRVTLAASHGGTPDPSLLDIPADPDHSPDRRAICVSRVARTGILATLEHARFVLDPPETAASRLVLLPLQAGRDIAGVLVLAKNRRLPATPDYRRFSELVAAQLSASLSAARVLADERHRAHALEQQVAAALAEREIAESRLRQSQKMEAIGKLTGGVAHDFNNLLQVVGGNLHLLSRDVVGNARAERRVSNALAGVARGAKLSGQLLAFSRKQPLEPKVVRISRLIGGLDDMLRRSLGEAIEIEVAIGAELWNTLVDPAQMENALLNLAINARDAMEEQGRLIIEAANVVVGADDALLHGELTPGHYVMVSVADTGSGMTPEIMEQVFEPFFSTKPEGKGTGLGLSMVYGFVKQSGGHIRIASQPGQGTVVRLYLPRTEKEEDLILGQPTGPVRGGHETILVAEDNEGVRDTVVSMLVELGYRVLKAKDAASALNVLDSGVRIDLLFTDVVMPGDMRGPDLARLAQERLPGLAVLFTSGYTEDAIIHHGRIEEGVELLSKPYTAEALARKLRQVLDEARAPVRPGRRRTLRILLVEDDALIRDSTAELLSARGHHVVQVNSAEIALDQLGQHAFDVLVTDLGLPGLDGVELARRARAAKPLLGVVFATGETALPSHAPAPDGTVLLRKPYTEQTLSDCIDQAVVLMA